MTAGLRLADKTIICTFPPTANTDFLDIIAPTGINVCWLPTIDVAPIPFETPKPLNNYHWLVFTSKNGVNAFFETAKPLPHQHIAVLGGSTAKALAKWGVEATFIGSGTTGMTFADELLDVIAHNQQVLMLLGNLAPNAIGQKLANIAAIDRVDVYKTVIPQTIDQTALDLVRNQAYDAILVASPSSIENLVTLLGEPTPPIKAICIGNTTAGAMRKLGIEPLAIAKEQTYAGLAQAAIDYLSGQPPHQP
jgi:uroporphyrinogen-III synthase